MWFRSVVKLPSLAFIVCYNKWILKLKSSCKFYYPAYPILASSGSSSASSFLGFNHVLCWIKWCLNGLCDHSSAITYAYHCGLIVELALQKCTYGPKESCNVNVRVSLKLHCLAIYGLWHIWHLSAVRTQGFSETLIASKRVLVMGLKMRAWLLDEKFEDEGMQIVIWYPIFLSIGLGLGYTPEFLGKRKSFPSTIILLPIPPF